MAGISFSGHHPAVRRRHAAAAPGGDRADVGHRRPLHGDRLPGRHLQLGLRAVVDRGAHGRRQAGARRAASPGRKTLVKAGRQALHRQPEAAPADAGRAHELQQQQPVPHAVAVRPARARRRGSSAISVPTFLVGQFQDEQTGGHFAESLGRAEAQPERLDLAAERRARRLARADDDHALGRVPQALRGRRDPGHPARRARPERRALHATSPTRAPRPVQQSRFAGHDRRRGRQGGLRARPARAPADGQRRRPAGPGLDRRDLGARLRAPGRRAQATRDALLPRRRRRARRRRARRRPRPPRTSPTRARAPAPDAARRRRRGRLEGPAALRLGAGRRRQGPRLHDRAARAGPRDRRPVEPRPLPASPPRATPTSRSRSARSAPTATRPTSRTAGCARRTASSTRARSTAHRPGARRTSSRDAAPLPRGRVRARARADLPGRARVPGRARGSASRSRPSGGDRPRWAFATIDTGRDAQHDRARRRARLAASCCRCGRARPPRARRCRARRRCAASPTAPTSPASNGG